MGKREGMAEIRLSEMP